MSPSGDGVGTRSGVQFARHGTVYTVRFRYDSVLFEVLKSAVPDGARHYDLPHHDLDPRRSGGRRSAGPIEWLQTSSTKYENSVVRWDFPLKLL